MSKAFRRGREEDKKAAAAAALDDTQVEKAMEDSADGAASSVAFASNARINAAAGASATAAAAAPAPPPPASSSATTSAEAAPHAEATTVVSATSAVAGADGTGPVSADSPAVTGAQATREKILVVEPSAAPRVSVQALSSTPAAATAGGVGSGRGRPSTLGRPGMAPAKVSMPIVGGRAAWNKFLASTAPGESAPDGPGASTAEASADSGGGQRTDTAEGGVGRGPEESDSTAAAAEEQAGVLAARGPRGFKSAADSQEGPNKGPAGAFSGNAMWRLSAGATSAANRARSGVAANGHGGYSNPLAAMRAGGNGAASGDGADGGASGGGGVANPLAGLRGAASMGGAGTANPLARGRGARPGGAGGVANPLARGSTSTASGGVLRSGPSVSAGAAEPAMPSGGVTNAEDVNVAEAAAMGAEGVASTSTSTGGNKRSALGGALDVDRPTEFRAIGSNGSWPKSEIPMPPRRSKRAEPQVDADPGQAKVGGLVVSVSSLFFFSRARIACTMLPKTVKVPGLVGCIVCFCSDGCRCGGGGGEELLCAFLKVRAT